MMRHGVGLVVVCVAAVTSNADAQFVRVPDQGTVVSPKTTLHTNGAAKALAFSPDGKLLSTASDKLLQVWDVAGNGATPKTTMPSNPDGHAENVMTTAWNGQSVTSGADDGKIKNWNALTGARTASNGPGNGAMIRGLAFSPDGKTLAVAVTGVVEIRDATTLSKQAQIANTPGGNEHVIPVRYTADGHTIITFSSHGTMRFFDATSGRETRTWRVVGGNVAHASANADGSRIACASTIGNNPKVATIHNGVSGAVTATITVADDITDLALSPNGSVLAIADLDKTVRLYDATNGHIKATLRGHGDGPIGVAWSPDGSMIASGANNSAILWDVPH